MFYPPFLLFFILIFVLLLFFLFALVQYGLFTVAFARLGIAPEYLFSLLLLCIAGSMVNIPIRRIPLQEEAELHDIVRFYGMRFRPPRWSRPKEMVLAVNVGGAIIPSCISIYLLIHAQNPLRMLIAMIIVAIVTYRLSKPVPGMGIAVPMLVPPIVAALAALLLNSQWAPPTAYFAGTLGTLIGADLLHLDQLKQLQAPVASIGGAGTFDGIFLTGILAVLLA